MYCIFDISWIGLTRASTRPVIGADIEAARAVPVEAYLMRAECRSPLRNIDTPHMRRPVPGLDLLQDLVKRDVVVAHLLELVPISREDGNRVGLPGQMPLVKRHPGPERRGDRAGHTVAIAFAPSLKASLRDAKEVSRLRGRQAKRLQGGTEFV